jgi:hypothetical protein
MFTFRHPYMQSTPITFRVMNVGIVTTYSLGYGDVYLGTLEEGKLAGNYIQSV